MRGPRRVGLFLVSLLVALTPPSRAAAEWILDVLGGAEYDDNVNRAAQDADQESDVALLGLASTGYYLQLTDSASLSATADLRGTLYARFDQLSSLAPGVGARARYKFGLGRRAPWVQAFGTAAYQAYREEIRSGLVATAGARAGTRLHDRLELVAGYTFDVTDARNSVFSVSGNTASARGTVALTSALDVSVEYAVRWGDVVVTRSLADPTPPPSPSVVVDTFDTPMLASRIDATTHAVSVDLSYALTRHLAAMIGFTHRLAQGPKLDYPDNAVRALLLYTY
jgi:hypothetical protein